MELLESESELVLELLLQLELGLELELGATCAAAARPLFGSSEKGYNACQTWLSLT